jgi:hypothetical protein
LSEAASDQASPVAVEGRRDELDEQLAAQLVEHARAQGASLLGPDGLLGKLTKLVFETGLEAEIAGGRQVFEYRAMLCGVGIQEPYPTPYTASAVTAADTTIAAAGAVITRMPERRCWKAARRLIRAA